MDAATASIETTQPLDEDTKSLTEHMLQACALAPTLDQANLVAKVGEAQADDMMSRGTVVDPGLARQLLGWQTPKADGASVTDYRALNKVRPDLFTTKKVDSACLDRPKSWFHW